MQKKTKPRRFCIAVYYLFLLLYELKHTFRACQCTKRWHRKLKREEKSEKTCKRQNIELSGSAGSPADNWELNQWVPLRGSPSFCSPVWAQTQRGMRLRSPRVWSCVANVTVRMWEKRVEGYFKGRARGMDEQTEQYQKVNTYVQRGRDLQCRKGSASVNCRSRWSSWVVVGASEPEGQELGVEEKKKVCIWDFKVDIFI